MRSILDLVSRIKITFLQAEEQKYFFFEPKGEATVSLGYDNNGNKNSFMEFHYQILTSLLFFLLDISSCGFFFFFAFHTLLLSNKNNLKIFSHTGIF